MCVQYYYAAEVWISNRNFSISFAGESRKRMKKPDKSGALKPKTMSSSMLLAMERFSRPNSFQQDDDDNNALGGNSKFQRCFFSLNASALQFVSSLRVTLEHVLTLESFILCMISSASVLTFSLYEVNGHRLAANVSWAVISFVIIFPLTSSLSEAFKRRERALEHVATFKATWCRTFTDIATGIGTRPGT